MFSSTVCMDPPRSTTSDWARDACIYHLYPLGALGAPGHNVGGPAEPRLGQIHSWLDHLQDLGVNTLLLGPVFESSGHGYDTRDYFHVDRRLGTDDTLASLSAALHQRGMRLLLDAVFHHTGRDFWAFREVREAGLGAPHASWYLLNGSRRSPLGDPVDYETWDGHHELAKLNLADPSVRAHLFAAVTHWFDRFGIDGLRLDAADRLDTDFRHALAAHVRQRHPDAWLFGEVVFGDYRGWTGPGDLDATTNYELYKALWSAHNDHNYFELAHSLEREFGPGGLYRDLPLYNFADNHDVDRVASTLRDPAWLYPLYLLLFTVPGVPSLYYGSEIALEGRRSTTSDRALRPELTIASLRERGADHPLTAAIRRFSALRRSLPALRRGDYVTRHIAPRQFAFERRQGGSKVLVAVNAEHQPNTLRLSWPDGRCGLLCDRLEPGTSVRVQDGTVELTLPPCWGRVLEWQDQG